MALRVTGCHGFCEAEPNVVIQPQGIFYQKVKPQDAEEILSETALRGKVIERLLYIDPNTAERITYEKDIPFYERQLRSVSGNSPLIDPTKIEDYVAIGGYAALAKVLSELNPEEVVSEVEKAGLRGRGGAGFPTARKWQIARAAKGDLKYIVCNADEGDPGAYMDRSLLEGNPHSVLEGMLIGAYAIGASEGFIYVRNEYPLAVENIGIAINQAERYGLIGKEILGCDFDFVLRMSKGAGAFVCGEETALIASIEGRRGVARQRPPFPAQKGLWGKPTNINNVETWANVPLIISKNGKRFSEIGTERSRGTKIFSLVGKINNTGLVEVPMGTTLREIIYEIGGGIPNGRKFKAVQTGGPSGGCMPTELLDLPIDYERLAEAGSMMGSGGMIVMDEDTCMVDVAKYFLNFLKDESCGKCLSCREGTQRMHEIVSKISRGQGTEEDLELLEELAYGVKDASMCGLGQTASNPVLSTLRYFRDEYEEHVKHKRCSAAVCKEMVSAPCQHVCPIDQEASVYIALTAQGRFEEALDAIRKDNPLPTVCGRVCHHPCESKCRAGEAGDPIAIRALKRFLTDYGMRQDKMQYAKSRMQNESKVAIVGSGPAGLSAAYFLAVEGYRPTVFEAHPVAGGMLRVGIPEHRLPRDVLDFDIDAIKGAGAEIRTGVAVGKDVSIDDLLTKGYQALFVAVGAHKSLKLGIENEDAEGVLDSMEFLTSVNLGRKVKIGRRVGVIGGGNAAVDAARVARRLKGCEKVAIIYRRTRTEMPAFPEEVDAAIEEGVDIHFLAAPTRVLAKNGKSSAIECVKMKLGDIDKSGRRRPLPIKGSEFTMELDTVIRAIGEQPDLSFLKEGDGLEVSKWNTLVVNPETLATKRKGVFAGGDAVTGPTTVVEAIGAGKMAAQSIDKYLRGENLAREYSVTRPSVYIKPVELTEEEVTDAKRPEMPVLPVDERVHNFKEVELGLSREAAVKEARRCLRCELETEDGKRAMEREGWSI